jgi:hypothetical protein
MRKQNCALLTMGSLRHNKYFSGFDPRDVPGCALWLDAADPSSLTLSGSSVSSWADKSGNGRNASQSTSSFRPVLQTNQQNGLSAIKWDGVDDRLDGSLSWPTNGQTTLFIAYNVTNISASQRVFDINGNSYGNFASPWGTTPMTYMSDALLWLAGASYPTNALYTQSTTSTGWRIYSVVFNGTSSLMWKNGVSMALSGSGASVTPNGTAYTLGNYANGTSSEMFSGHIGEVIFYSGNLSTTQRQQIEGYLSWKWGLIPRFQNPTSISGIALWFDAADSNSLTLSGSNVTQWRDKVSNIQATPTSTVTLSNFNSNPIVRIPAGSEMSFTASFSGQSRSWFMVMRNDTQLSGSIVPFGLIHGYDTGDEQLTITFGTPYVFYHNVGGLTGVASANTTNPFNILQVYTAISSSVSTSSNVIAIAGSPLTLLTNNLASGMATTQIFRMSRADFNSAVTVCEVIAYNTALTTAQRRQVEGYLADKWGLRASLPSTFTLLPTSHPFYRSLPYTRAFNPLDIGGCSLWLDGADGGSMTFSGSNITQWNDKSGNGTNATGTGTPALLQNSLNSNSVVYFNGSSYFTGPQTVTTNTHSVVAVARFNSAGPQYARLASFGVNGSFDFNTASFYNLSSNTTQLAVTRNYTETNVAGLTADAYHIISVIFNGTNGLYYVDGGVSSNSAAWTSNFNFSQYRLGADQIPTTAQQLQGYIAEFITYSNALSTVERQQLERYLSWKWGVANQISAPTDIAGCTLWLDAADSNAMVLSGTNVTQWRDKSGNGYNFSVPSSFTSPTYSSNAINGLNSVSFAGAGTQGASTNILANTSIPIVGSAYSIFAIARQNASAPSYTGYNYILKGNTSSDYFVFFGNNPAKNFATFTGTSGGWNDIASNTPAISVTSTTLLMGMVVSGSVLTPYYNGNAMNTKTGTTGNFSGISLGDAYISGSNFTGQNWNGLISEIIIYNTALSTAERQQVEKYLARKWGLNASIPASSISLYIPPRTTAFSPLQLSNLALWLDAADSAQVTLSGSNITAWGDKSSNALSMQSGARPTYASNSLNGLPVVSFTTTQNLSSTTTMTLSPSNTWALVFNSPTGGNFFMAEHSSNINNVQGSYFLGANFDLYAMNRTGVLSTWKRYQDSSGQGVPPFNTNTWYIAIVSDNNTNGGVFFRRNGVTRAISNVNSFTALTGDITSNFFINHRLAANVNFGEILVYNRGLSLAEVQTLEGYLANKWGLQGSLPSTHPYVKITP